MKVTEDDGNKSDFYFLDNGRGVNGVKDNYLYYKGNSRRQRTARSMYATGWRAGIMWSTLPVRL